MSRVALNRLYADLGLLEFELEYLNNSLRTYYSNKYNHTTSVCRRRQIEYCRTSIPIVIQDIKDIKMYIEEEKREIKKKKYGVRNTDSTDPQITYSSFADDSFSDYDYDFYDDTYDDAEYTEDDFD